MFNIQLCVHILDVRFTIYMCIENLHQMRNFFGLILVQHYFTDVQQS